MLSPSNGSYSQRRSGPFTNTVIESSAEALPWERAERFGEASRLRIDSTDCDASGSSARGDPSGVCIISIEEDSPSESEIVTLKDICDVLVETQLWRIDLVCCTGA